ncbi:tetratricopeptide repeat protein [Reticulibacter mediterranei]|uniref:Tetratricopeptide repeat protein n=1 Tax=Reticulibacter mediterranei TaxID=2778369 RepID=A0A8J3N1R2_9CHLR|nr:FxSxx-COOH system tetratricopeptide repeat protein [Reticulibacter mediterranei]GHO94447.1 tetratricopeptide repeat protein [Reticulibacter mediterranei]
MQHNTSINFLISYHPTDQAWAEWIAWQLDAAGYSIHIEMWDVRPGMNFILELDRAASMAERTIAVLSPAYLASLPSAREWSVALAKDPTGAAYKLLPIRVHECQPSGLLASITAIDLAGLPQEEAHKQLLAGISQVRAKPTTEPHFPGETPPIFPQTWPEIWQVPYQRNPFFTDRERLLKALHKQLAQQKRSQSATALTQAISGLGGIGKTQTALEYAWRYGKEYRCVLWVNASSAENLLADYVKFAATQHIPGYDAQDQRTAPPAVKAWLEQQRDWLLILDNADDLAMIQDFLPGGVHMRGHILLTTRANSVGPLIRPIEVSRMDHDDGVDLLLKRSRMLVEGHRLRKKELRAIAETLVEEMDGLPLAIDQAAGYIDERKCSIQDYLQLYQSRRKDILALKNRLSPYYSETVATTWSLSFARIQQENAAAAELLRFCAFLAPDAIPEELITEGAQYLGDVLGPVAADPLLLNDAIEVLLRYSLIRRNPETKILSIHRLVQVVLRYDMEEEDQVIWIGKMFRAVWQIFAYREYETFTDFERYVPQIYICPEFIDRYQLFYDISARILHSAAFYLQEYARYSEAEQFYQKALIIYEKSPETEQRDIAVLLHNLGSLYHKQEQYEEAEKFYEKALVIFEKTLGGHPYYTLHYLTSAFNSRGMIYRHRKMYHKAIEMYQRALNIYQEIIETIEYPAAAITLQNIALTQVEQGKYEEAERLYKQAIEILVNGREMGAELGQIALVKNNLASLYQRQERFQEAESLYQQVLNFRKKALGLKHPDTVDTIKSYTSLLRDMNRENDAEMLENWLPKDKK